MHRYSILADLHTHSISSGHGSRDPISWIAAAAARTDLRLLGISDHGPATAGSALPSYFYSTAIMPRQRYGISMLYGAELNILNMEGDVDLPDQLLRTLDYGIISIHPPLFTPWELSDVTQAYLAAFRHPGVRFLGHIDDARFPVDFEYLLPRAQAAGIYPEINNGSLSPQSYRFGGQENCRRILQICRRLELPVLLSSDSHGQAHVGNMEYIFPLLEELDFPPSLILNTDPSRILQLLQK